MSQPRAYVLDLAALPPGESRLRHSLGKDFFTEYMENDSVLGADLDVQILAVNRPDREAVQLTVDMLGTLTLPCDRCLGPLATKIDCVEDLTLARGDDYDDSREGVVQLPWGQTTYDLAPLLYDMAMTAVPMRNVHDPGQCDPDVEAYLDTEKETI